MNPQDVLHDRCRDESMQALSEIALWIPRPVRAAAPCWSPEHHSVLELLFLLLVRQHGTIDELLLLLWLLQF
jgi:hypothetical protein